jgi:hypothetical protein
MGDLLLSIAMLGAIALLGGSFLVLRRGDKKHAILMLIAALVVFANVAIWMMPVPA